MKKELRLSNIHQLDSIVDIDRYDSIGIGSESCFHKMPDPKTLADVLNALSARGMAYRIITPFIPQRHLERAQRLLVYLAENISDEAINLTINDMGLFHFLKKQNIAQRFALYFGRLLVSTRAQTPWINLISKLEEEKIAHTTTQNSAMYHLYIDFLLNNNICGIESNVLEPERESLQKLKDKGLAIIGHADQALCAVSRVCPTARFYGKPVPSCTACCDRELRLQLNKILSIRTREEIQDDRAKEVMPNLLVHGNTYLFNKPAPVSGMNDIADTLVFDVRHQYTYTELQNLERIKS